MVEQNVVFARFVIIYYRRLQKTNIIDCRKSFPWADALFSPRENEYQQSFPIRTTGSVLINPSNINENVLFNLSNNTILAENVAKIGLGWSICLSDITSFPTFVSTHPMLYITNGLYEESNCEQGKTVCIL